VTKRKKSRRGPVLLASLAGVAALAGGRGASEAQTSGARSAAEDVIAIETGTLPIVLSAPHGGQAALPGVAERTKGTRVSDEHTGDVASLVAVELERELHARPSVVRARFHRRYLDVNRSEVEAFEDAGAKPTYVAYHLAVRRFVDSVRRSSPGRALLVDLHGQNKEPETLVRGTRDGKTVSALVARAGAEAMVGSHSIFGRLAAAGYRTDPPIGAPGSPRENRSFDGGFIVATYGSHNPDGIDAIQIEIGRELRHEPARRKKLARDLAAAIAAFHRAYLEKR
jgi:N-formylglutamate amidohydrolase